MRQRLLSESRQDQSGLVQRSRTTQLVQRLMRLMKIGFILSSLWVWSCFFFFFSTARANWCTPYRVGRNKIATTTILKARRVLLVWFELKKTVRIQSFLTYNNSNFMWADLILLSTSHMSSIILYEVSHLIFTTILWSRLPPISILPVRTYTFNKYLLNEWINEMGNISQGHMTNS